jgi:DNA-binding CsgD family transcriptional regulator
MESHNKRFSSRRLENNLRRPDLHISQYNDLNLMLMETFEKCSFIYYLTIPTLFSKKDIYCIDNFDESLLILFTQEKGWEKDPALFNKYNYDYIIWKPKDRFSNSYLVQSKNNGAYNFGLTFKIRRNDGGTEILSVATDKVLSGKFVEDNYSLIIGMLKKISLIIFKSGFNTVKKNNFHEELSFKEIEVIKLAADGYTSEESAELLFVTKSTINFHLKRIIAKLHCSNKTQAVAKAVMFNLV